MTNSLKLAAVAAAVAALAACQTSQDENTTAGATTDGGTIVGAGTTDTSSGSATTGSSGGSDTGTTIPALVNVNLENVLNDLSVKLKIDRANIPVNAQIPVDVAANVCGVSVSVLSVSTGGQASCTAKTATPELVQTVQQQIAAGGNVGGGDQTTGTTTSNFW
jgi:hypothetical protein